MLFLSLLLILLLHFYSRLAKLSGTPLHQEGDLAIICRLFYDSEEVDTANVRAARHSHSHAALRFALLQ